MSVSQVSAVHCSGAANVFLICFPVERTIFKGVCCALLAVGLPLAGLAQNLVPNPSFEEYIECPNLWNQMERATGWSAYRGTPDYLNACNEGGMASVPLNFAGNRYAADGEAYAAIIALELGGPPNWREHLGGELITPLIPDLPVFLSFKVIMATDGIQDDCRYSVDGVGMRFTMEPYAQNNNFPLPNDAAIHLTTAPLDMTEWTMVSGVYVPDSAYRYIVLGGFFNDDLITPVQFNPNGNIDRAFAFIDDICVSYDPAECGGVTSLPEHSQMRLRAFPNPFTSDLRVSLDGPARSGMEIWLQDLLGRRVWSGRVQAGQDSFTIDGTRLPEGLYVISGENLLELPSVVVVRVSP